MKSLLPFFLLTVLFADTKLGKPLELSNSMPVAEALGNGETLTGKTVQVRGKVTEVCQMAGCWMAIADASAPQKMIRIKVEDGVIIFPKDAIGKTAIAEGTLTRQVLTKEEALKELQNANAQPKMRAPDSTCILRTLKCLDPQTVCPEEHIGG